jgi:hypothetical protein
MGKMQEERGRPARVAEMVSLGRVRVPREVSDAIDTLVAMSGGTSKATFIRQALLAGLRPYALISPELEAALPLTAYYERNQ